MVALPTDVADCHAGFGQEGGRSRRSHPSRDAPRRNSLGWQSAPKAIMRKFPRRPAEPMFDVSGIGQRGAQRQNKALRGLKQSCLPRHNG
jgi:hypothetical protein